MPSTTRHALWLALCAAAAWLGNPSTTHAQSALETAESAYDAGRLDEASSQLQAALRTGDLGPQQVARVYRLIGILSVADGNDEAALNAFSISLALSNEQSTPPELGPEQAASFEAVRAERSASPFVLNVDHDEIVRNAPVRLDVEPSSAPLDLIATYRVSTRSSGAPWTGDGSVASGGVTLEALAWRGAERMEVEVSARDRFGNTLTRQTLTLTLPDEQPGEEPVLTSVVAPPRTETPPASGRKRRILIGVIAGVVLAGAATGLGLWLANRPVPTTIELGQ